MKLVEIHWIDSMGMAGWQDADALSDDDMVIHTVGWLVEETQDAYVVSASKVVGIDSVYAPLKIPKVAVTGVWEITL